MIRPFLEWAPDILVPTMALHTRRRFLQVAAAVAGGFAGCANLTGDAELSSKSTSERDAANGPGSSQKTELPTVLARADSEQPPIRLTDPDQDTTESSRPDRHPQRIRAELVDSRSKSQRLTTADGVDSDSVSSFVSVTDFDSETLYLESVRVEECFRLQFCHISWQPSKIQTDYVRQLRPYDERCTADETVFESRLIRLPAALDSESLNSYGTSVGGSGRCNSAGRARAEGTGGSRESTETTNTATDGGA